jgi:ABC-type transport system substrate-binding protein
MRSTGLRWLAVISFILLVLVLPRAVRGANRPKYGGTLRVELHVVSVSLDPRDWKVGSTAAAEDERLATLIYDRLVTLDDYGRFQPALAAEWSHDAAEKNWQFKLRPGVKFSNGSSLTSSDVAKALQGLLPPPLQIVPGDNNLTIRSSRPVPDLLEQLASGRCFVFRKNPDGTFLGTGPFYLAENIPAQPAEANPAALKPAHLKFRANEEAWAGRPFVDTVEVTLGAPGLRQILDLQVGRADLVEIAPDLVRKARQDNLRVWRSAPATLLALRFDNSQRAASDDRLREAIDLALDRDTMANVLLQREAQPATALLPQWLTGYAFIFGSPMNLNRAREIRAALPSNEAGTAEPLRLRVDAPGDLMKLLGERVAVNARQANLAVQVTPHAAQANPPASTNTGSLAAGLHLLAWHYESLSPRAELEALVSQLDQKGAVDTFPSSADPEKLYAEERRLLEERQLLPLIALPDYVGIGPAVRNWSPAPWGEWRLADVWLEASESTTSGAPGESSGTSAKDRAPGVRP